MRLINVHSYRLRSFPDPATAPPYAALSHTWSSADFADDEVTYADLTTWWIRRPPPPRRDPRDLSPGSDDDHRRRDREGSSGRIKGVATTTTTTIVTTKQPREEEEVLVFDVARARDLRAFGWAKLELLCSQADRDGHDWAWLDTCCIDRSSSAEVAEAVNQMWSIYARCRVCYAYLPEVQDQHAHWRDVMRGLVDPAPRWFRRGWTLLELLAPWRVDFFGRGWTFLGGKAEFADGISRVTGISVGVLIGAARIEDVPVATRLCWAADRAVTRPEDAAYSLMGLFGVHIPVMYGEGARSAWLRLQEEIMKQVEDHTLFVWDTTIVVRPGLAAVGNAAFRPDEPDIATTTSGGMLAPSLACFASRRLSLSVAPLRPPSFSIPPFTTPRGLRINLHIRRLRSAEIVLLPGASDPDLPPEFSRDVTVTAAVRSNDLYVAALDAVVTNTDRRVKILLLRVTPKGADTSVLEFVRLPHLDSIYPLPAPIEEVDIEHEGFVDDWKFARCCVRSHARPKRRLVAAILTITDRGRFGYSVVEQLPGFVGGYAYGSGGRDGGVSVSTTTTTTTTGGRETRESVSVSVTNSGTAGKLVLLEGPTVISFLLRNVDRPRRPALFVVFVLGYRDYVFCDVFLSPSPKTTLAEFHADYRERARARDLDWETLPPARYGTVYALKRIVEDMKLDIRVTLDESRVQDTYRLSITMSAD